MIKSGTIKYRDTEHLHEITLDRRRDAPLHAQVRNALESLIDSEFKAGDIFYPEKLLVEKLAVSRITIRRALGDLRLAGRLSSSRGAATIVNAPSYVKERQISASANRLNRPRKVEQAGHTFKLKSVGIIAPVTFSESQSAYMAAVSNECALRGLKFHPYNVDRNALIPDIFDTATLGPQSEGILMLRGSNVTTRTFLTLSERGYRTVAIDGVPAGYPGRSVTTDSADAVQLGLDHLFSLGHRRITLLVNEPLQHLSVSTKVDAFQRITYQCGYGAFSRVVPCAVGTHEGSYASAYGHMDSVWSDRLDERPTAIFTLSDPGAWAAIRWLTERNISIPNDVSVLGFEDSESSRYIVPSVSSVAHPRSSIVARALDLLEMPEFRSDFEETIEPYLVIRESTGAAPFLT